MRDTSQKARGIRVLLMTGAVAAALLGYVLLFAATGRGIPCALHELTGLRCAGCGLTRAAAALLAGDVAASFAYNPIWPVYAAYFLWVGISDAVVYVRRGQLQLLPGRWWLHASLLAAVTAFGILRNFL